MRVLGDIPRKNAKLYPDKVCVVFEDERSTWRQFNERINRLAHGLMGMGLSKGDHLAVLMENCPQYLELYFAAAKCGIPVVPLNFRLSLDELTHIMNHSDSVALAVGAEYVARTESLRPGLPAVRHYIAVDGPVEGMQYYEDLISAGSPDEPSIEVDEDDMAILMYTGGTTGLPKGVMLSHRNILTSLMGILTGFSFELNDSTLFVLPLFHISLWAALVHLCLGASVVIVKRPDLGAILGLAQRERVTHVNMVPTLYAWLVNYPQLDKYDLSSIRFMSYAGSPMPVEVLRACIQRFGPILGQGYGLTEAAPLVSWLMPEDHVLDGPPEKVRRLQSAGREAINVDVRVVDEDGRDVEPGQVGEIVVRGANVTAGYWKDPELTAETIVNGWLHTGDMATVDDEGYMYIVDRKHDMIISGGENIYPREIEEVLYRHPAVLEAAVVGVPDETWGEAVKAVVVLKPGQSATEQELIDFCKADLASYKKPRSVEFVAALPKTTIGKILRREVKKKYWEGRERLVH
jgi:acyl-CoA synthetase (AMP-forming)/AMP-acid ligase II